MNEPRDKFAQIQIALKVLFAIILITAVSVAVYLLFTTQAGDEIRSQNLKELHQRATNLVHSHPLSAPAIYLGIYILIATLGVMPVWWLQILAGAGFGLYFGTLWTLIGATTASAITVAISRWLASDFFHKKVESKMQRLQKLDSLLGHNGFLVVMSIRLVHLLPFGICNYALGITKISMRDVIIGTFLGTLPAVALSVGAGAGYLHHWQFYLVVATINILLLLPVGARYLFPEWFHKIGLE